MVAAITADAATGRITVVPHASNLGQSGAFVAANDYLTLTPRRASIRTAYKIEENKEKKKTQVFDWECKSAGAAAKYAPGSCR